jgi:hypothetical protein
MTTPHVHCTSHLPTAHEPPAPPAEDEGEPEPPSADESLDGPAMGAPGDEWGDGRVPARVAPMSLRPLG